MAVPVSYEAADSDCTVWHDAIAALADGELGSLCAARTEAHLAGCAHCARRVAEARAYKRVLRRVGESERAPAELRDTVMAALRGARGSRTA